MTYSRVTAALVAVGVAAAGAGCGSTSATGSASSSKGASSPNAAWKSVAVDVGNGHQVTVKGPPRIALFADDNSDPFIVAQNNATKATAKAEGVSLTFFDANQDPSTQFNQMQSALASKRFNAWILVAADAKQACQIATQQAPKAGILVSAMLIPLCNGTLKEGQAQWVPGTLNYIGGNETVDSFAAQWKYAVQQNPGPQTVGVLTGPPLNGNTIQFLAAMKREVPSDWKIVQKQTDFTIANSRVQAQSLLTQYPDMKVLVSQYTGMTQGAVGALEATNRVGKVKVYDALGSKSTIGYVKSGVVRSTSPLYSASGGIAAVKAIVATFKGAAPQHYIPNDGHALEKTRVSVSAPWVITKNNLQYYHPENN